MAPLTPDFSQSPAAMGYRMPAEWEPHEAMWLAWPRNPTTWPGKLEAIPPVYARIVRGFLDGDESVRLLVKDIAEARMVEAFLRAEGAWSARVELVPFRTSDSWARDFGACFVVRGEANEPRDRAIVDWGFDCWGRKYPDYEHDNRIPRLVAARYGYRVFSPNLVLEGGSIDVNGRGTVLTTKSCLLNPNRHAALGREVIEDYLAAYLDAPNVIWLGDGIAGDDTDGHIDDMARFTDESTIVMAFEDDPRDENHEPLRENLELLRGARGQDGQSFDVVTLPMPDLVVHEGERLPASYANFTIANTAVLVPTYRCRRDSEALGILGELFPDRRVIGIDCTDLVLGLGAIHCITQQQPAG